MNKSRAKSTLRWTSACVAVATVISVSACGGSSGSSSSGSSGENASSQAQSGVAGQLATLYKGVATSPVTTAPKPQPGKKVWIISIAQQLAVAQEATQGAADAARSIGWRPTVFDGKGNPSTMLAGIQQAIAAKADGIITYSIDCSLVKNGLTAAAQAHIPVVAAESQDCSPSLEHVITYSPAIGTYNNYEIGGGSHAVPYMVAKGGTHATFIELKETDTAATLLESQGWESELKKECPACKNVVVTFTQADIGPALQQKVQQAVLQNPTATGVYTPYDTIVTSGVSAAVMASGRANSIYVITAGDSPAAYALIREHRGLNAELVSSFRWEGFATVDWMNRLFHGTTPNATDAATGIGFFLVDATHGLPTTGSPQVPVNFQAIYEKAWGVSK